MNIVFICPYREVESTNIWATVNSVTPPLGFALLAAIAENNGWNVRIIDSNALGIKNPREVAEAIPPETDFVAITSTTPEIIIVEKLVNSIRAVTKVKILLGGVHPTLFHEELLHKGIADIVFRGEGEISFQQFVSGVALDKIKGLSWKDDSTVVVNPDQDVFIDLNDLPVPAYHLLPMEKYRSALGAAIRRPSIGMISSRGCPGQCTFCYSAMFGNKVRTLEPEAMLSQIQTLMEQYGIREISFYDDTFTANRKRVERFCNLLIDNKLDITWSCFARVDTINLDLLQLMRKAGCHQVSFGIESADDNILLNINKKTNQIKIDRAIQWCKQARIDVRGAFMLGNVGENEDSMRRTIAYAKKLGIKFAMFNITTPYPGTELYRQALANDWIICNDWQRYDLSHAVMALPNLPPELIEKYYREAYSSFYFSIGYMLKRLFSIRSRVEFEDHFNAFLGIFKLVLRRIKGSKS